jgi:hypothetical protein
MMNHKLMTLGYEVLLYRTHEYLLLEYVTPSTVFILTMYFILNLWQPLRFANRFRLQADVDRSNLMALHYWIWHPCIHRNTHIKKILECELLWPGWFLSNSVGPLTRTIMSQVHVRSGKRDKVKWLILTHELQLVNGFHRTIEPGKMSVMIGQCVAIVNLIWTDVSFYNETY